jgi:DNA-binding transcriptional LysR family regulator
MTIEDLVECPLILYDARYGWSDPTRSQLYEAAQRRGLRIEPVVEVEHLIAALTLVSRGVGGTIVDEIVTLAEHYPKGLHEVAFADPLHNTFAFITRNGAQLSPATREVVSLAQNMVVDMVRRLSQAGKRRERPRR